MHKPLRWLVALTARFVISTSERGEKKGTRKWSDDLRGYYSVKLGVKLPYVNLIHFCLLHVKQQTGDWWVPHILPVSGNTPWSCSLAHGGLSRLHWEGESGRCIRQEMCFLAELNVFQSSWAQVSVLSTPYIWEPCVLLLWCYSLILCLKVLNILILFKVIHVPFKCFYLLLFELCCRVV